MTKIKFLVLSLIAGLFLLNTQQAAAQDEATSEDSFAAEFTAYASNHTDAEVYEYAMARMAGMTDQALLEDDALMYGDCHYEQEAQICKDIYAARLAQLTAESAVLAAACAVLATPTVGPYGAGLCLGSCCPTRGGTSQGGLRKEDLFVARRTEVSRSRSRVSAVGSSRA